MIRFIRRWRFEIIAAAAIIFGLFLLLEQYNLSTLFMLWLATLVRRTVGVARTIHISDVLGIALLVLAAVLLVRGSARRIRRTPKWSARACPVCGQPLRRTKRRAGDVVTWFLPLRRFRCRNCGWTGLRARSLAPEETDEGAPEPLAARSGSRRYPG